MTCSGQCSTPTSRCSSRTSFARPGVRRPIPSSASSRCSKATGSASSTPAVSTGCPIGRLALEIDPENTPAHELIARNFAAWRGHVEACLRAAGVPEPGETAALVLAVMEGAVMQSRAERNLAPFDACIRRLRAHFDQLILARPPRRARSPKRTS